MTIDEYVDERTRFEMYYPPFAGDKLGLALLLFDLNRVCTGTPTR